MGRTGTTPPRWRKQQAFKIENAYQRKDEANREISGMNLRRQQHNKPAFQAEFDSTPPPDTLLLLPSGIRVSGVESWVRKLAEVYKGARESHTRP